jgi:hypothetical protein
MVKAAVKLAKKGCSNNKISENLKITVDTYYRWRREYPEFDEAIADARLGDLDDIEQSMGQLARGYEYQEESVEIVDDGGRKVVKKKVSKKQAPPNLGAQKFILSNRRKARWAEKIEAEVTGGISIEIGLPEVLGGPEPSEDTESEDE